MHAWAVVVEVGHLELPPEQVAVHGLNPRDLQQPKYTVVRDSICGISHSQEAEPDDAGVRKIRPVGESPADSTQRMIAPEQCASCASGFVA